MGSFQLSRTQAMPYRTADEVKKSPEAGCRAHIFTYNMS